MTSRRRQRLPGVLFAVALALQAGIAQAQPSQEPILNPDAVSLASPENPQITSVDEYFSLTLPVAIGDIAFFRAAYTLSPLPPGMNFDAGSRRLYGTPTEVGRTRLTYRVEVGFRRLRYYAITTFDLVVRSATKISALNLLGTDSLYTQGEVIEVEVIFNRPVTVRGSPILELSLDSGTVQMSHANPTSVATSRLLFKYTIQSRDETDGISIGAEALRLYGGSITDETGIPANLSLAEHFFFYDPRYQVDGTPPRVTDVTFTTRPPGLFGDNFPSSYLADEEIKVRVDFAEPVTVTGSPRLRLDIGTRRVRARYDAAVHNTNNRSVGFTYRVQPGDLDPDGISIAADALASVGTDTITDAAGNPTGDSSLAEHAIGNDPAQTVDAIPPQVTEVSILSRPAEGDTYRAGETIQLRVAFSKGLLTHPPNFQVSQPITLSSGTVMAEGMISPQSHTYHGGEYHTITEIVFHYTVQAGDYDADGISYLGRPRDGGNFYSGGTYDVRYDVAGNFLLRDITDLIITNAGQHKVDGGGPRVTNLGIASRPDQGDTYRQGEEINVTLTFNQPLVGDLDNLRLTLNLDSGAVVSQRTSPSVANFNRLVGFTFIVQDGDLDENGISIGADALSLTGGSVTNAGNDKTPLLLSLAEHTVTNDPHHKVDAAAPKVTHLRIVSTPAQGAVYRLGEMIRVRLTLDQPVIAGGSPILSLPLLIGDDPRTLTFDKFRFPALAIELAYQVQGGDLDEDGISIGAGGLKVTGGSLADIAGNQLRLSLEGHTLTNAPAHQVGAVPRFDVNPLPEQIYTVGQSVSLALPQAIGGVAPRRYGLTGSVPPGLVFDADTRTLSGTPSAPMAATELQWMVTDAVPSVASLRFQMTVVAAPSFAEPLRLNLRQSKPLPVAPAEPIKLPAARDGAPPIGYTFEGTLPPGLVFNSGTRVLSGRPTEDGVSTLTYTATDANGALVSGDFVFTVDSDRPRVTSLGIASGTDPGHTYRQGEKISVTLLFNDPLVGDPGNLQMTLNLDSGAVVSQRTSVGSFDERGIVSFIYTVQDGDLDEDGISIGADALSLTGGSVTNPAGRPLILSLAQHTITNHPEHKVDAAAPKVTHLRIVSTPAHGEVYGLGEMIRVRLTLDQLVRSGGSPILSLPLLIGDVARTLTFEKSRFLVSVIELAYQVQIGDLDEDGISVGVGGLNVSGGSLADAVGNPLRLSLEGLTLTNAPAHQVGAVPRFMDVNSVPEQIYTVGQSVSLVLPQAIGGVAPRRYELLGSIPPGLVFDADTRTLSGTPSAPVATTELQWMATDAVPSVASLRFQMTIVAAPSFAEAGIDDQIYTASAAIPDLVLPQATSALDLTYTLTPAPAGLAFDRVTRTLSGAPTTPAAATELEWSATDSNGVSTPLRFLVSIAQRPTFDDARIANIVLTANMPPINRLLPAATGGVAPLTYTLYPQIPAGLSFDQRTRRLSGTPTSTATIAITYTATDWNGAIATTEFFLFVLSPLRFGSTIPEQTFTVGRPVLLTLPTNTSGGYGDKQYTLNEDALPGWLGYDRTTHTLGGTPPAVAEAIPLRWQVRDVNRAVDTLEFSFSVVPPPSFVGIRVDDQIYTASAAIPDLALPAPQHGAMPLSYTLLPVPDGLAVDRAIRTLSGTPTTPAAATELEWSATDSNGASDSLRFQVRVAKPPRFVAEVEDMLIRASRYTEPMILPLAEHGHGDLTYNLQEKRGEQIRDLPERVRYDPARRELSIYIRLGVYVLVYTATDANGAVASQEFTVEATKPQFPGSFSGHVFDRGVPITPVVLPAATGGIGEVTYTFQSASHGIKYNAATRSLYGTPTIATAADLRQARLSYVYVAEDELGGSDVLTVLVRVRENGDFPPYIPMYFDPPIADIQFITRGIAFERVLPQPQGGTGANPVFQNSTSYESLPPGIQFNRHTRRLHGTAEQVTTGQGYSFRYTVIDVGARETISERLRIRVVEQPSFAEPLRLSLRQNELLPIAPIGPIKLPAARDGAPQIVYTLEGDLPPGLAFDPGSRALSGRPTEDGVRTLTYTATDANGASVSGDFVFTVVDAVAPAVTGVSIISTPNQGGIYLLGEQIRMRLDFSEPVFATVSPPPTLNINLYLGSKRTAMRFPYPADSDEPVMSLEGSYTVQEGDLDEDGISNTQSLFIAGLATDLTDAAGNRLLLRGIANSDHPKHKVDGVVPKVSFVLVTPQPANHNTYALGEEIKVVLAFDSFFPVLQGQLSMQYTLESGRVTARNSRKHGLTGHGLALDFSYVVQSGDLDKNGFSLGANALMLVPEENVTDESGNPVNLSLADFAFTDDPAYQVDGVGPQVTAVTITSEPRLFGYYRSGERITARVDFDEPVTIIDDAPVLWMSLGDDEPRRVAMEYAAVQPDDTSLLFGYTVQAGDEDNNGISIGANALEVTSGMVTDIIGNPADLSLSAQAISNDPLHKVDGVGPRVTSVNILSPASDNPDPSTFKLGEYIRVLVSFDTYPSGDVTALRLALGMDSGEVILPGRVSLNTPRQILFRHTVQLGDLDKNGVSIGADALSVADGGSVTDDLGNPVDLSLAHVAITDEPTRKVDGVPPDIVVPAAQTFESTATLTPLTADDHYGMATSSDGTAIITDDAPDTFPLGLTIITWTATDPAGNAVSATQVVTVADATPPEVTGVSIISTPNDRQYYGLGDEIEVEVLFSEPTGGDKENLNLTLTLNSGAVIAQYKVQENDSRALFTYTVQAGDEDSTGISMGANALSLTSGSLADAVGNAANLDLTQFAFENDSKHRVDGVAPEVESADITSSPQDGDTYRAGEQIVVTVVFTEPVLHGEVHDLRLKLNLGGTEVITPADGQLGLSTFKIIYYTVQNGDYDPDGISFNALHLVEGGSAVDLADNPLTLIFPAHAAVADQPEHKVDAVAPEVTNVTITSEPRLFGYYRIGERITVRVDFDEPVTVIDEAPVLWMSLGDDDSRVAMEYAAVQLDDDSLLFGYTVQTGDEDNNGVGIGADALEVTSGMVTDIVGNPADLSLTAYATSDDPLHKVDGVAPEVTGVSIVSTPNQGDTYILGEQIRMRMDFSEPLVTDALPKPTLALTLYIGTETTTMRFPFPADSNASAMSLEGSYTVKEGDLDEDGISNNTHDLILIATGPSDLTDVVGNPLLLRVAANPDNPNHKVDGVVPDIVAPLPYSTEATATLTPLTADDHYDMATTTDDTATITHDAPATFPLGDTIITWTATDASSNEMTAKQIITVVDTTAPVITLLKNTADNNRIELGTVYTEHGATATDAVDGDLTGSIDINTDNVDANAVGEYTVTYNVSDAQNNAAVQKTRTVMVTDTTAPSITAPHDQTFEATATATPLSRDDYGIARSSDGDITDDAPDTFPLGDTIIIWTATDASSNEMTAKQTITVVDTTAPVITLPADVTKEATGPTTPVTVGQATATDLAADSVTITRNPTDNAFAVGVHKITWTATDSNGRSSTAEQTITITDTTAPVITLPADVTKEATGPTTPVDVGQATAIDLAADSVTITRNPTDNAFAVGVHKITWTATDASSNEATATQTVTITDKTAPVITLPADVTKEATGPTTPVTVGQATAIDLAADSVTITRNPTDNAFAVGVHKITWTATDASSNEATATQTITITDETAPVITLTGANPQTIEFGEGYAELEATATDLVDDDIELTRRIVIAGDEVITDRVGEYQVTYDVTDAAGNAADTVTRTVRVIDAGKPVITLTGANPQIIEFGTAYTELNATATDRVDDDTELTSKIAIAGTVNTDRVGDYSVTYDVTDTAGNAAEQKTRTVRVIDTGKPIITLTGDNPQTIEFGMAYTELNATATDLVDGELTGNIVIDSSAVNTDRVGDYSVTYDVTDTAGNAAEQKTRTVRVIDTGKPIITLTGDNPQTIHFGMAYTELNATATDAVDGDLTGNIVIDSSAVNTDRVGDYSVTYDVTDTAGNAAEQKTRTVRVIDTGKPIITLTGANPQIIEFGEEYAELNATATDRVDGDLTGSIVIDSSAVNTDRVGEYTVAYDVTDAAGNAADTVTRTVMVTDTTAPAITAPDDETFEATATLTPLDRSDYGIARSSDGDITDDAPDTFPLGDTIITWTATDASSNEMTAKQTITVVDTTAPVITLPADVTKEATGPTTPVTVGQATATDLAADSVTITRNPTDNAFAVGVHKITWTATDSNGRSSTAEQTITITDKTAPVITLTGANPQTIEFGEGYTELNATATDLVDDDIELTGNIVIDSSAVNTDRVGDYSVTYDVTDTAGNAAEQKTRTVRVIDNTKPIITLTGDNPQTIEFGEGYTELNATATDRVDGDLTGNIVIDSTNVVINQVGTYEVTYNVTDAAGNAADTVTRTVRVIDAGKPVITLTGANPQTIEFGTAYTELEATATDRVDGDLTGNIVIDSSAVNTDRVGDYSVTYDAADTAGNAAEQKTRTVRVIDNTKPIITLTGDNPQTIHFGMAYTELNATATDLVDGDLTGRIVIAGDEVITDRVGEYQVTYDVTDTAGNAAEQKTRRVRVIDTGKPIITLTGDNPQTIEFGEGYTELKATATDLVDDDIELTRRIVIAGDEVITDRVGEYQVTYDVTDTAGNAAEQKTRTVRVIDTGKPIITRPVIIRRPSISTWLTPNTAPPPPIWWMATSPAALSLTVVQ